MPLISLEVRVLRRAIELMGGERPLAKRLRVPMHDLQMWLDGTEKPTRALFLAAVDVLIEHDDTDTLAAVMPLESKEPKAEKPTKRG